MAFCLATLCCLMIGALAQHEVPETPHVKFTSDLFPLDKAPSLELVKWREPIASPVYCVSRAPVMELQFACPTCDVTTEKLLLSRTKDMTYNAGYPAIKLFDMPLNADQWTNTHNLRCIGFYHGTNSDVVLNVTVDVPVEIMYLKKPAIVLLDTKLGPERGHYPVMESGTNKFYLKEDNSLELSCKVDSNPLVDVITWYSDHKPLNNKTNTLQITKDFTGKTINCHAKVAELNEEKESSLVLIETLNGPNSVDSNFQSLQNQGVIHPHNNAIPLENSVDLQCSVSGSPKPKIRWFHMNSQGKVNTALCDSSSEQKETPNNPNWMISSDCKLRLDSFDYFGQYWCSGCIEYAQNISMCTQSLHSLPNEYVFLNVSGPPKLQENVLRSEQSVNLDRTTIFIQFCANPIPLDFNSYWMINNDKLQMNERLNNVFALPIQKNKTHSLCYEAPLIFENPQNSDKLKSYQLFVSNSLGQLNEILPIGRYIVGNETDDVSSSSYSPMASYDPTALGIGLAVFIFIVIGLCLCAYLWFKSKACFSFRNSKGKPEKYQSNLASSQLTTANENGSEKPTNTIENEPQVTELKPKWSPRGYHYVSKETLHLNGHNVHDDQTYIKSYDDFDLIKETENAGRPSVISEKEKMLPKSKERKYPTDSAV